MLKYPEKCLRELVTCRPYGQIQSEIVDGEQSFFCCGIHDGSMAPVAQDKYTLCFSGKFRNDMTFSDRRDLVDQAAVIMNALQHIELDMLKDENSVGRQSAEQTNIRECACDGYFDAPCICN